MTFESARTSRNYIAFVVTALLSVHAARVQAADYFPMAGGNAQRTGYISADAPIEEPAILWQRPLGVEGDPNTQPIIDEAGNVYVTAAHGKTELTEAGERHGALVSFDPEGNERWRYTWSWDPTQRGSDGSTSQLSVPVLVPDGKIVMGLRWGWVRCWNRDTGELVWERDLSPDLTPITSAPVVDEAGYIYVYLRDTLLLHKIDSQTGDLSWVCRFPDGGKGNASSPALSHDQRTVYIGRTGNSVGYVYAIDAADGRIKWAWSPESATSHSFAWSVPAVDQDGAIFIQDEAKANCYMVRDLGPVHAIKWTFKRTGEGAPRLFAVDDCAVYSSCTDGQPVVFALSRSDGSLLWEHPFDEGAGVGGLVCARNAVCFGLDGTGKVIALNPATGNLLWQKQLGTPEAGFSEGLALDPGGRIYVCVTGTQEHPGEPVLAVLGQPAR